MVMATFVYIYLDLKWELSIPKALNDFPQIQNFETLFENDESVARSIADHHKVPSLADCIDEFVRPEHINDSTCEKCHWVSAQEKSLAITKLPKVLVSAIFHFYCFCSFGGGTNCEQTLGDFFETLLLHRVAWSVCEELHSYHISTRRAFSGYCCSSASTSAKSGTC